MSQSTADAACTSTECTTDLNQTTLKLSRTEDTALRDNRQALPAHDHLDLAQLVHADRPAARPVKGLLTQHFLQDVVVMDRLRRGGATRGRGRCRGRSVPAGLQHSCTAEACHSQQFHNIASINRQHVGGVHNLTRHAAFYKRRNQRVYY